MISRQCVCLHIIVYQDVQTHSNWCMNKTKTKKKENNNIINMPELFTQKINVHKDASK